MYCSIYELVWTGVVCNYQCENALTINLWTNKWKQCVVTGCLFKSEHVQEAANKMRFFVVEDFMVESDLPSRPRGPKMYTVLHVIDHKLAIILANALNVLIWPLYFPFFFSAKLAEPNISCIWSETLSVQNVWKRFSAQYTPVNIQWRAAEERQLCGECRC